MLREIVGSVCNWQFQFDSYLMLFEDDSGYG